MSTGRTVFWVRSDVVLRALIPVAPKAVLSFANLRKFIAYQVEKHGKNMTFVQCKHIMCDKLQLSPDVVWAYFSTFLQLLPYLYTDRNVKDYRAAVYEGPNSDLIANEIDVPITEFVLFLALQMANRITTPFQANEVYPSPERSPSVNAAPDSPRFRYDVTGENRVGEFMRSNLRELFELVAIADTKFEDYHRVPACAQMHRDGLVALDFLLEGNSSCDTRGARPETFSSLVGGLRAKNGKVSIEQLYKTVSVRLMTDPFSLLEPVDLLESKSSYIKKSKPLDPQRRLVAVGNLYSKTCVRSASALQDSYLRINNCISSQLYLPANFQCASIQSSRHSQIVLGPVAGVVRIRRCSDCTFLLLCARIKLVDCHNCTIYVKTPSNPLLCGNNTAITFAPYCSNYEALSSQMERADLNFESNLWNRVLNLSPVSNPTEPIWSEMLPERFYPFAMPFKRHRMNEPPIMGLPERYQNAVQTRFRQYQEAKDRTIVLTKSELDELTLLTKNKFKEWLKGTAHGRELKQLYDIEKILEQPK